MDHVRNELIDVGRLFLFFIFSRGVSANFCLFVPRFVLWLSWLLVIFVFGDHLRVFLDRFKIAVEPLAYTCLHVLIRILY